MGAIIFISLILNISKFLVKVDFTDKEEFYRIARAIPVHQIFKNSFLTIVKNSQIKTLSSLNVRYRILETYDKNSFYYIVFFLTTEGKKEIYNFGEIVLITDEFAIIRFKGKPGIKFFSQKWEVKKLKTEPLKLKFPEEFRKAKLNYNPLIEEIIQKVSQDSITSYIERLQAFVTRYASHDSCFSAAEWLKNKLLSFGYDSVYFHEFSSLYAPNVVCIKFGEQNPDDIYIIGAHYDCTSENPQVLAPGADDNASGTACVLEAARVLVNYRFDGTIRFILFGAEELGLIGSDAYANECASEGQNIVAMLNFDMIGYDENTKIVEIHSNYASEWLANHMAQIIDTYITELNYDIIIPGISASDHASFWDVGYDAIMGHEYIFSPYYHSTQDSLHYLDPVYYTLVSKAGIGTLASIAGILGPEDIPYTPSIISPFNFSKLPVTNPLFKLFTEDPDGDEVIYKIYWDLNPTFISPDSVITPSFPSSDTAEYYFPYSLENNQLYWFKVKATDINNPDYWSLSSKEISVFIDTTMSDNICSWFQTKGTQFNYNQFYGAKVEGDSVVLEPIGYDKDTLLFENFESGLPSNWVVVDGNSDGYKWQTGVTDDLGNFIPPNYGTSYAYYSDDDAGSGVINTDETIISPPIHVQSQVEGLNIEYSYGFRVYQDGETYTLRFRYFSGSSWSSWIELVSYTNSANGTETIDLSSYLPCDSVQFKWTYNDENSFSNWGWACAFDNVYVYSITSYQNNYGIMFSSSALYEDFLNTYPRTEWGYIIWEKSSPQDSIGIQVEYYNGNEWSLVPDSDLPGNSQGFYTQNKRGIISISSLDFNLYHTLRSKVIIRRQTPTDYPALLELEIGALSVENKEKVKLPINPSFAISSSIFRDNLRLNYYLPANTSAKIKIFKITGRTVKEILIISNKKPIKSYYIWKGEDQKGRKLKTGIYFIKFHTKNYSKTVKTVLFR